VITRFKIFNTRSEVSEFKYFAAVNERKTLTALGFKFFVSSRSSSSGAGCHGGGCETLLLFFHASHFVNRSSVPRAPRAPPPRPCV
jgi:hypothetical protein